MKCIKPYCWIIPMLMVVIMFFCSPQKELQVHEEMWEVVRVDTIFRHNDRGELEPKAAVVFHELKSETEYTLYTRLPTQYWVGRRIITLNR